MSSARGCIISEWERACTPRWNRRDMTLPDNTGDCSRWRVNHGRYDVRFQMPPSDPEGMRNRSSDMCEVAHLRAYNHMPFPIKLYYWTGNAWESSRKPMFAPGECQLDGNAFVAHGNWYMAVDENMRPVKKFQISPTGETVVYIRPE